LINETRKEGLSIIKTHLPIKLSDYANKKFILVKSETKLGEWENLPYQIAILDWFGDDDIKIVTIRKSARTGATKLLCINWAYKTEHLRRDMLIYQPTADDAKDFKDEEIDGLVYHMPSIRSICKSDPDKRSSNNTVSKLSFKGSTTHILGGKTPRNFRRMTKDETNYDELSGFDSDIGGEGSVTTLGDTRFETSSFGKSIRSSTPKTKGSCQITDSLDNADVVMFRWLPCPECGEYQYLKWRGKNKKYHFDFDTNMYICEHNGCMFGYDKYAGMDAKGQWRSIDGSIVYDEELGMFFENGNKIKTPRHVGVDKLWSAYSYFLGWENLINMFREAVAEQKKTGDKTKLKSFINTKLGEEWEERGESVPATMFTGDRLDEDHELISSEILFITMGVDVQGGKDARLEYEIVGHGLEKESWSIEYNKIKGDPDSKHVWDNLDEVRKKIFTRRDGVRLRVSCCCIDSGYQPDSVYKYTRPRIKQRVYATKGHSIAGKPIIGKYSMVGPNGSVRLYMIGTDTAKEALYYRLNKITQPGPGYCHFPAHYEEKYFEMLTAEEKREERNKRTGRKNIVWVKIRPRNEALDCRVMNMAALEILNPSFPAIKRKLDRASTSKSNPEKPKEEIKKKTRRLPTRPKRKTGGWFGKQR